MFTTIWRLQVLTADYAEVETLFFYSRAKAERCASELISQLDGESMKLEKHFIDGSSTIQLIGRNHVIWMDDNYYLSDHDGELRMYPIAYQIERVV